MSSKGIKYEADVVPARLLAALSSNAARNVSVTRCIAALHSVHRVELRRLGISSTGRLVGHSGNRPGEKSKNMALWQAHHPFGKPSKFKLLSPKQKLVHLAGTPLGSAHSGLTGKAILAKSSEALIHRSSLSIQTKPGL